MRHQILSFLLIASLGPVALDQVERNVMLFDVRRVVGVEEQIVRAGVRQSVPWHLVMAIALRESGLRPAPPPHEEENGSKSWGVMQLNDRWFPDAATMTVAENIDAGAKHVGKLIRQCGTQYGPTIRFAYITGHCRENSRLERP